MPSALFNAMQPQRNDLQAQLDQFKAQFAPNSNPMQIIQQMMQSGQISQQQFDAAYQQAQQLMTRR